MTPRIETLDHLIFSYFYIDLKAVRDWSKVFFAEEERREKYIIADAPLDLEVVRLGNPHSGGVEKTIALIFSPRAYPMRCVFVSNSQDGWYTLVNCICRDLGCKCIRITSTLDNVVYPANSFRVYEQGRDVRFVRAMLDSDRWDFFEEGAVQQFENAANYRKRRIRDRLNRAVIIDYLKRIDIDIYREDFWTTESTALYIREN
jgi:hypothetical protein